ncbi:hypothetical protein ABFS83_12G118800 [Erythranthe nasuta]
MFRGNNSNTAAPSYLNNHFQYPPNVSNQQQLCGNLPVQFHADPVNYIGNNHGTPILLPNEAIPRKQKLQFSLNNNNKAFHEEHDRKASIHNLNHVSTGLRLSCDDEERNSSITSASGSLTSSVLSSLTNDIKTELDQQNQELDHFIRIQEEDMVKGVRDIRQKHIASFLASLQKGVVKKLREKDLELETITRKNKELVESVKQVTNEAQNWCYMAKYNESVVNVLKTNLQQAVEGSNRVIEGQGENEEAADDANSYVDPNNYLKSSSSRRNVTCRSCKAKEVSVLLMPCRHLCLCKECEGFVTVCPVCQMVTTASLEVYLS